MKQHLTLAKPLANVLLILAAAVPLCKANSVDMGAAPSNTDSFNISTSQVNGNVVANTTAQHTAVTSTQYDTLSTGTADYANMFETTATSETSGISVTLTSNADLNKISLPLTQTSSTEFVVLANGTVTLNGNGGGESPLIGATNNNVQVSYVPVIYTRFAPALPAPIISVPANVPEPATYFITGLGLALLVPTTRRLRRHRAV